jgi:hypothetical protein
VLRGVLGARIGLWRSLVARLVRDEEAAGSNPVSPTRVMSQDIADSRACESRFGCCHLGGFLGW